MEDPDDFAEDLSRMGEEAAETAKKTEALVDRLEGRKTAIRDKARETKGEAVDMMNTYLGGEEEALDGFEFLSMAEAAELRGGTCVIGVGASGWTPSGSTGPRPISLGSECKPVRPPDDVWPATTTLAPKRCHHFWFVARAGRRRCP